MTISYNWQYIYLYLSFKITVVKRIETMCYVLKEESLEGLIKQICTKYKRRLFAIKRYMNHDDKLIILSDH